MMDQCLSMMPQGVGHRYALLWKLHSVKVWLTLDALRRSFHQSRAYLIQKIVLASGSTETLTPTTVVWITTLGSSACMNASVCLAKMSIPGNRCIRLGCPKPFGLVWMQLMLKCAVSAHLKRHIDTCCFRCSIKQTLESLSDSFLMCLKADPGSFNLCWEINHV